MESKLGNLKNQTGLSPTNNTEVIKSTPLTIKDGEIAPEDTIYSLAETPQDRFEIVSRRVWERISARIKETNFEF